MLQCQRLPYQIPFIRVLQLPVNQMPAVQHLSLSVVAVIPIQVLEGPRPPSTLADKTTFWLIALLTFDHQYLQCINETIHTSTHKDTRLVRGGFGGPESLALFRSGVDFKAICASGAVIFSLPCSFRRFCPIVSFSTSGKRGGPLLGEASISLFNPALSLNAPDVLNVLYTCGHVLFSLAR